VFHTQLCDMLGIRYPIIQGALGGISGGPQLAAAVSNAAVSGEGTEAQGGSGNVGPHLKGPSSPNHRWWLPSICTSIPSWGIRWRR